MKRRVWSQPLRRFIARVRWLFCSLANRGGAEGASFDNSQHARRVRLPRYRGGRGSGPASLLNSSTTSGSRGISLMAFSSASGIRGVGSSPVSL